PPSSVKPKLQPSVFSVITVSTHRSLSTPRSLARISPAVPSSRLPGSRSRPRGTPPPLGVFRGRHSGPGYRHGDLGYPATRSVSPVTTGCASAGSSTASAGSEHTMTAEAGENDAAAQAQSRGEAAEARHLADTQAQHQASGSTVVVEQASTPDDTAVSWFGSGADAGQANVQPSTPPAVNSYDRDVNDRT